MICPKQHYRTPSSGQPFGWHLDSVLFPHSTAVILVTTTGVQNPTQCKSHQNKVLKLQGRQKWWLLNKDTGFTSLSWLYPLFQEENFPQHGERKAGIHYKKSLDNLSKNYFRIAEVSDSVIQLEWVRLHKKLLSISEGRMWCSVDTNIYTSAGDIITGHVELAKCYTLITQWIVWGGGLLLHLSHKSKISNSTIPQQWLLLICFGEETETSKSKIDS